MQIMVIGGGGREHALVKALKKNPTVEKIYCLPGNGGIAMDAECVAIGAKDILAQVEFAKANAIDYAVVAPDDPLAMGAVDALTQAGIPCFGPDKAAAIIESSKAFAKDLMKKYNIPTAAYEIFTDAESAKEYLKTSPIPVVIKADGLALGKGVIIAETREEAMEAVSSMMQDKIFGESGSRVVIEEFLTGPEVSVLSFTDGETVVPMVSSMDHKDEIFLPTIRAMKAEGRTFKGCLYFGLMITKDGPKVIEYNCRFGDPETQVVLPLLKSDLLTVMQAVTNGTLKDTGVEFSNECACCVVMASGGYPGKYPTGFAIHMDDEARAHTYVAGAKVTENGLVTGGGRVLGVTATAPTLDKAVAEAYRMVGNISFEGAYFRRDIGHRALAELEK